MSTLKMIALSTFAAALLSAAPAAAPAQISLSIGTPQPYCPYGYFDYAPYQCAPYGYYGPDWFNGGIFIGAGPWFHGHRGFYGHVDNRYDPRHGYNGPFPDRGERPLYNFHGNEARDGQGHIGNAGHDASHEHFGGNGAEFHGNHGGGDHGGNHGGGHH
jgi:hypothetical protein